MQYQLGDVDLSWLNEEARKMSIEVSSLFDKVRDTYDLTTNVSGKVSDVRSALLTCCWSV